jgi:L-proline amide hydrolase
MTASIPATEGFIPFRGHRTWYRSVGGPGAPGTLPLLCLHGGPGGTHDYLEPLEALSAGGRRVIVYDQLGCGNSDQPHDPSLWTIDLFLDELVTLRRELGLERLHLLGQSWGGMLAMEYMLRQPAGVASLVLSNSLSSTAQWEAEANRLRAELPPEVQAALDRHEVAGTTGDAEYIEAMLVYYRRHFCRADPWPECVTRSLEKLMQNPEVYNTMWGPSEFHPTGTLKTWDITGRLGDIRVPTLILSGGYDESTPLINETLQRGIPGSRWVLFEQCAHNSHVEETARYLQVVEEFLAENE